MNGTGLFGSAILEVAIGLFFVYLLLSLVCSSINELLASFLKWRAKNLQDGIQNLVCDSELFETVMAHPLIKAMGSTRTEAGAVQTGAGQRLAGRPSYIPSDVFAIALLDSLAPAQGGQFTVAGVRDRAQALIDSADPPKKQIGGAVAALISESRDPQRLARRVDDIKSMVEKLPRTPGTDEDQKLKELAAVLSPARTLREIEQAVSAVLPPDSGARQHVLDTTAAMQSQITDIECGLDALHKSIAKWYDDAMDRVSGVYKRKTQAALLAIAVAVSCLLGADSLRIVTNLSLNPSLRAALAEEATRQSAPGGALSPARPTPAVSVPASPVPSPGAGSAPGAATGQGESPSLSTLVGELTLFSTLFGYGDMPPLGSGNWVTWLISKLVGIPLTVFAISLGAPFWFDLLGKVANLRGTGKRPERLEEQSHSVATGSETTT